jgi:hypothetical protein
MKVSYFLGSLFGFGLVLEFLGADFGAAGFLAAGFLARALPTG